MDFLNHKGSKWVDAEEKCERDGKKVFVEVREDGTKTDHYCCERSGCTKQDYRNESITLIRSDK